MTVSVGSCPAERDARLRVGFVGAGKIGFALGTHLFEHGSKVSGYASRTQKAALWASQCTHSVSFSSLQALLDSTDLIFITVPDGAIGHGYEDEVRGIKKRLQRGKGNGMRALRCPKRRLLRAACIA